MNFRIKKSEFLTGLSLARGIADTKATLPILANVLLRASGTSLLCAATDLNVAVAADLKAEIASEGAITLGARHLGDIVKSLPAEDMTFKLEGTRAEIKSGKATYKLAGIADRDFPKLPNRREVTFTKLPTDALRDMIAKTIFSVSLDESRYHLNGVFFESDGEMMRMVSTDGHRLSKVERKFAGPAMPKGVIIPRKGLAEIARAADSGDCEIGLDGKHAYLRRGAVVVSAKLVDAQFPPYGQVIPKTAATKATVDRGKLIDSLRRVAILASEKTSGVRFAFTGSALTVSADIPDMGEATDELDIDLTGPGVTASYNSKYLVELLGQMPGDEVNLGLGGELDPLVVTAKGELDYLGVIMPMRM